MDNKIKKSLSWDDFQALGNPENAPELPEEKTNPKFNIPIKAHYEKKGRGGKETVIIRGFDDNTDHDLEAICKTIKSKIGVGGSVKDNEIIIQGNQRDKIVDILKNLGFTQIKKAGG